MSQPSKHQIAHLWDTQETRAAQFPHATLQLFLVVTVNSVLWRSPKAATASVTLMPCMTVEISLHPRSGPMLMLRHTTDFLCGIRDSCQGNSDLRQL